MTKEKFDSLTPEQQKRVLEITRQHKIAAAAAASGTAPGGVAPGAVPGKAPSIRSVYSGATNLPAGSPMPITPGLANQNLIVKASPSATPTTAVPATGVAATPVSIPLS